MTKTAPGFSLKERPKTFYPAKDEESSETSDFNKTEDVPRNETSGDEGNSERKPWQDRNREGGGDYGERKPWQDRNREGGGGYGERKPWQDRNREGGGGSGGYGERKPWQDRNREGGGSGGYGERKPWQDRNREGGGGSGGYGERKPWQDRNREGGGSGGYGERKPWQDRNREGGGGSGGYGERKPWQDRNREGGGGGYGERKPWQDRNREGGGGYGERKPWQDRNREGGGGGYGERKPWQDRNREGGGGYGERRPWQDRREGGGGYGDRRPFGQKPFRKKEEFFVEKKPKPELPTGEGMPLNKYLAHCGVSSRRKAVEFVKDGQVTVNGEVKLEPHYRVQPGDAITCEGKEMNIQERQVYVLLNKPKNVITTTEDEHGRATVLDIVDPHFPERLYPVGRLDRDTTGLILLTNDGDLAQKLSHPSYHVQKQYRVGLDRGLSNADFEKILAGVELEDGPIQVNWLRYAEDHPRREVVELEIIVGRNRIVRRLFESLGYQVKKLDRFYYGGLTKKDLPRGAFRELTQREIIMLKHFTGHPTTGGSKRPQSEEDFDDNDIELEEDL
ncbi:MAG: pseudouridine synthase [Saprospiraceae bacterium]